MKMDRRSFLEAASGFALAGALPGISWAAAPDGNYRRLLILVELKGANDGLNTVIPYADPAYRRLRPRIAIERDKVLALSDSAGLHPSLEKLLPAWSGKELAIVQGIGYPEPNLSHFRSIEIWDTASKSSEYLEEGWLTRAFGKRPTPKGFVADAVVVGSNDMGPLAGHSARAIALTNTEQFLRNARLAKADTSATRNPALAHVLKVERDISDSAGRLNADVAFRTEFPQGPFGNAVKTAAQLAANPAGIAVIRLTLNGFDTHANQAGPHANLLRQLGEGLAALREGLIETGRWNSTLVLTYAEFGRRPQENQSGGTDHGTANVHFALGGRVKGGFYGEAPRLEQLDGGGNLSHAVDFRSIYATVLGKWWEVDAQAALRGTFAPVEFLKA
jgi:uncharacterized protein (DUF1501 family)